jgi:hypothetical protein
MTASSVMPFDEEGPRRSRADRRDVALTGFLVRSIEQVPWEVSLSNLSYGGCRLQTDAKLKRGEAVRLSVAGRGKIDAVVRWTRGASAGLSFLPDGDRSEAAKVTIPREAERLRTRLNILVRRQGRRGQWIDGHDISPLGCRLEFVDAPRPNDRLWVQLPGLEAIEARVRWVDGNQAGILFANPIHPAVYELLLDRWKIA